MYSYLLVTDTECGSPVEDDQPTILLQNLLKSFLSVDFFIFVFKQADGIKFIKGIISFLIKVTAVGPHALPRVFWLAC
ncbi:hypothetical protein LDENG_00163970 [Lucifuga dentata]|nr:hypothetical protein LDENG_00163970 [Lucifuga dentata]